MNDDSQKTGFTRWQAYLAGATAFVTAMAALMGSIGTLRDAWCSNIGVFCSTKSKNDRESAGEPLPKKHPPGTTVWTVDKSYVYLDTALGKRQFFLIEPSSDLLARGARPDTPLFIGEKRGESYVGRLFAFPGGRCPPFQYDATGPITNNDETVTLIGKAPQIDPESCVQTGDEERTLVFNYRYK
jgi:hypothetical protein